MSRQDMMQLYKTFLPPKILELKCINKVDGQKEVFLYSTSDENVALIARECTDGHKHR